MSVVALQYVESLFDWVWTASWQASVLALLVLLLQRMLGTRLNPRWGYALWLLVLARLVLPTAAGKCAESFSIRAAAACGIC